ncbi:hypothetical protein [Williamsia sp. D3]|uniref:hypothetical protein n=1 Tax=Williamsia sp. D3 TaxID=1313067 RepID=UPI0003D3AB3E|nr:hypothetical protein [Williamsia sp. D3]ETD31496.1 hypothetical protein W823_18535 [Williamsia sp. D3]
MLTTPGEQVERLLRDAWPAIDPDMIGRSVERYRVVAQRLLDLQHAIVVATAQVAGATDGLTGSALAAKATALADHAATAAHLVGAESDLAARFSDLVALTHERLTVAAAMADRDLQAARVVDVTTGDITAAMGAEHAAATVLAAVAGDFESGSRELADNAAVHAAEQRDSEHGQTAGNAAGAPMMPGADGGRLGNGRGSREDARRRPALCHGCLGRRRLDVADPGSASVVNTATRGGAMDPYRRGTRARPRRTPHHRSGYQ